MVDIPDTYASDGIFAVERTGSELFSRCGPHTHSATTAICYSTLAYPIVVRIYSKLGSFTM